MRDARGRRPLTDLAKRTIAFWFRRRHDSEFSHHMARTCIRDAKLWRVLP